MVTIVSIVLMAVFLIFINPILNLFGATDTLRPYALEYGSIIGIGLPFMMISAALNSMIRADGSPKYAMLSMILGAVINTFLTLYSSLFFTWASAAPQSPRLWGKLRLLSFPLYIFAVFNLQALMRLPSSSTQKSAQMFCALGSAVSSRSFAITIVMALTNNLLADYGASSIYGPEIPLTATGIVMKVNQILISILIGISVGAQPIIGFNYGAKNFLRVKKALDIALVVSEIISVVAFLIFQFAPMCVVSLFGSEEGLYNEFAVKAFRIFLLLCPFTGFQTVVAVYLQAVGKPLKSALLSLSRQIIFFVPTVILLPRAIGVMGVLWTGLSQMVLRSSSVSF